MSDWVVKKEFSTEQKNQLNYIYNYYKYYKEESKDDNLLDNMLITGVYKNNWGNFYVSKGGESLYTKELKKGEKQDKSKELTLFKERYNKYPYNPYINFNFGKFPTSHKYIDGIDKLYSTYKILNDIVQNDHLKLINEYLRTKYKENNNIYFFQELDKISVGIIKEIFHLKDFNFNEKDKHKIDNYWEEGNDNTYKFPSLISEIWEFYYNEKNIKSPFGQTNGILIKKELRKKIIYLGAPGEKTKKNICCKIKLQNIDDTASVPDAADGS